MLAPLALNLSDIAALSKLEIMTAREAALYMRSSTSDLAKLRHLGGGPLFIRKSARKILYRRSDLDAWLSGRAFSSTSAAGEGIVAQAVA